MRPLKNLNRTIPPLKASDITQLERDCRDIKSAAKRKNLTLSYMEENEELSVCKKYFNLGCWLYYYSTRVRSCEKEGFDYRVDCARRIFQSGIMNPHYNFYTIFDFGEREFDTIFEMGDAELVIDKLREIMELTRDSRLLEAFKYYGWPIKNDFEKQPELSFL